MPETILVVVEQQQSKLNRVSLETIAAAQAIAKETGWQVEIAVLGHDIAAIAEELAGKKAAKVYAIECPQLAAYTSDGYVHVLKEFLAGKQPKLVLMPHTYQVRDFAPRLALALGKTVIPDAIGYKYENGKLLFTRQMFQGKFAADVSFSDPGPLWMATFQNAAFRGDAAEGGTAPVETLQVTVPDGVIRVKPHEIFKEAKQAVDLSQSESIVAVGRGIKEQKNLAMAEELAKLLGGDIACIATDLRRWLAATGPPDRQLRPDHRAQAVYRARHQRSDSAYCRHERLAHHHRNQQRCRGARSSRLPTSAWWPTCSMWCRR